MLRNAASVSAIILHKAEWRDGSVVRMGGPRAPADFLLSVRQFARLHRIAALFINPLVGDCRRRLRFP